jgi:hypothetical protein
LDCGIHESEDDLATLQELLDNSYAAAGRHLLSIHTPKRRLTAEQLAARLTGMCLLTLATVTADGRPLTGPVDGVFYRGAFHFGSGANSVRVRHLRIRPEVSATHLPSEEFAVTVHGSAAPLEIADPAHADFRSALLEIYLPRYGPEFEQFIDSGPVYARIDATRMFAINVASGAAE